MEENRFTEILNSVTSNERLASEELLPLVYDELRRLAAAQMVRETAGQTLQPTALVHEAWLRLAGSNDYSWENQAHFFGAAARAMRQVLVEVSRKKATLKRGSNLRLVAQEEDQWLTAEPGESILQVHEGLTRLESENPASARIVLLKFFGGLSNEEVAKSEGIGIRTVERRWTLARARLYQLIRERGSEGVTDPIDS